MAMSNTMIAGATKIWYYVPENKSSAFEAWLEATRPGYIENLEAGIMIAKNYVHCTLISRRCFGSMWTRH